MFNSIIILGKYRNEANLPPDREDTLEITKVMRASSPPATTSGDEIINQKRSRPFRRVGVTLISCSGSSFRVRYFFVLILL